MSSVCLHDSQYRFAKEYSHAPGRGYGSGVIQVLRKLASPQLSDVFQPARAQFGGRGSFGNGGAMRAAPFALAFRNAADVKRVRTRPKFFFFNFSSTGILLPSRPIVKSEKRDKQL